MTKKTTVSSFNQAVRALQAADIVVLQDKNSESRVIASFVGWKNEDDMKSDFIIYAEGCNELILPFGKTLVREGHVLKPTGCAVVLELYKAMK